MEFKAKEYDEKFESESKKVFDVKFYEVGPND